MFFNAVESYLERIYVFIVEMVKHTRQRRIRLKDPLLQIHMRNYLGPPSSEKYQAFMKSLDSAKKRILGESVYGKRSRTRRRSLGGSASEFGKDFIKKHKNKIDEIIEFVANQLKSTVPPWIQNPSPEKNPKSEGEQRRDLRSFLKTAHAGLTGLKNSKTNTWKNLTVDVPVSDTLNHVNELLADTSLSTLTRRKFLFSSADQSRWKKLFDYINGANKQTTPPVSKPNEPPLFTIHGKTPSDIDDLMTKEDLTTKDKKPVKEYELYTTLFPFLMKIYLQLATDLRTGKNSSKPKDDPEPELGKLRDNMIYTMELLRELNLYANPLWFDEMYYYFYYLNLNSFFDGLMGKLNDFKFDDEPSPKRESKTTIKRYAIPSFADDRLFSADRYEDYVDKNRFLPMFTMKTKKNQKAAVEQANSLLNAIYYGYNNPAYTKLNVKPVVEEIVSTFTGPPPPP